MHIQTDQKNKEFSGTVSGKLDTAAANTQMEKLHGRQGHGFAAEQANNKLDLLQGKDAKIVGGDNAKNGADRCVDGNYYQSKYYKTAAQSVNGAFDKVTGKYRYYAADGSPMKLEVPADQYDAAIAKMKEKIANGDVPGVTDPKMAKELIAKGNVTYAQALRLSKAGTIESLTFDAATGAIIAVNAFGISATVSFALACWRGEDLTTAIEDAVCTGLQVGGTTWLTHIAVSQLNRLGLNKMLTSATDDLIKVIGKKNAEVLALALKGGATVTGEEAMNSVAKLLRNNIISSMVVIVVLSAKDIKYAFQSKISGKQLFKNVATVTGGVAGASGGAALGSKIGGSAGAAAGTILAGPGAGTVAGAKAGAAIGSVIGGAVGGTAGAAGTNKIVGAFVEDDAVRLVSIIEEIFTNLSQEALLTIEENENTVLELQTVLTGERLLEMHASPSHRQYGNDLVEMAIKKVTALRNRIALPTEEQMLLGLTCLANDFENKAGLFSENAARSSAVLVGEALTGKTYSEKAAKMGLYAAKQINATQNMTELKLHSSKMTEEEAQIAIKESKKKIAARKASIESLLEGELR